MYFSIILSIAALLIKFETVVCSSIAANLIAAFCLAEILINRFSLLLSFPNLSKLIIFLVFNMYLHIGLLLYGKFIGLLRFCMYFYFKILLHCNILNHITVNTFFCYDCNYTIFNLFS